MSKLTTQPLWEIRIEDSEPLYITASSIEYVITYAKGAGADLAKIRSIDKLGKLTIPGGLP